MKKNIFLILFVTLLTSCSRNKTIQIGENTYVHDEKVYRIIDNQITKLGDMDIDEITESKVLNPKVKDYGKNDMSFVKPDAFTELKAVYRGNVLYFKVSIKGFNDLNQGYRQGGFTLNFVDEFNFTIHNTEIPISDLTTIVNDEGTPLYYEYNGNTEMSSEVNKAIKSYSLSSSVRKLDY